MKTFWMINKWRLLESVMDGGAPGGGPTEPDAGIDAGVTEGDSNLFTELAEHDEDATPVLDVATPPLSSPAAVSPPVVVPPAATPGLPSQVPPGAPPATPTAVPPGTPAATGVQPPAASVEPPVEPPQVPIDFEKHRAEFVPKLAEQLYQLDEETVEAARTDPGKVLPTLAARVHYEVQHAVFAGVMNALPQMIANLTERNKEFESNENTFYSQFPTLKEKAEYGTVVAQSIQAIRSANPKINREDLMTRAGLLASLTLGLAVPGQQPQPSAAPGVVPAAAPRPVAAMRPAGVASVSHVEPPPVPGMGEADVLEDLLRAHEEGLI